MKTAARSSRPRAKRRSARAPAECPPTLVGRVNALISGRKVPLANRIRVVSMLQSTSEMTCRKPERHLQDPV